MNKIKGKTCSKLNLLAAIVATFCSSQVLAAAGDICVDDGVAGAPDCVVPNVTITTNNQDINTGTGSVNTTSVTATGTIQGGTLTDNAGTTITGGDIDANTGTIDTLDGTSSTFTTYSDGAGTTITGGDIDANTGTIDTLDGNTATYNTFDDGTVTLSGGALSDGTNSITMDGTDATVNLNNGNNALSFDGTGASMSSSDGTTTGNVAVTDTQASVTVNNGTATHGLTVGTSDTVLSGGTTSTSLTLNDAGAQLDNTLDMGSNRIINLADGINPLDAVNRRQLDRVEAGLQRGIAAVAAIAAVPAPIAGHRFSIGIGGGFYEDESAIAAGFNADITDNLRMTGGVGSSSGETVSNVGFGFSW